MITNLPYTINVLAYQLQLFLDSISGSAGAFFYGCICMYIVSLEFIKRYPLEQHEQNDIIQWIKYKDFNIKKKNAIKIMWAIKKE